MAQSKFEALGYYKSDPKMLDESNSKLLAMDNKIHSFIDPAPAKPRILKITSTYTRGDIVKFR